MNFKSNMLVGFAFLLTAVAVIAQAKGKQNDENELLVITANKVYVKDLTLENSSKGFSYDWLNSTTIAANKSKAANIESVLKKPKILNNLTAADKQMVGKLQYQLGTYYLHVEYNPDKAIEKINRASAILKSKEDQAWIDDNLAFAYEQKYAATHKEIDKQQALNFSDIVVLDLYKNTPNQQVAFAYTIKSMVQFDAKEYADAEITMKRALEIYEGLNNGKNDQYIRAKNKMAVIMLNQQGRDEQAVVILNDVKSYWQAKGKDNANPYAASNLMTLGYAHYKAGQMKEARDSLNNAIVIYSKLYGEHSPILVEPYRRLADIYQKLGDSKNVEACLQKAGASQKKKG